ncbi:MAG: TonB-dependent receptor [Tahibacter sp.]
MSAFSRARLAHALWSVLLIAPVAQADTETATALDTVEVTSSKIPTSLRDSAASVTVVSGDELRARGAFDLRTALSLVAGVDIAPGGDGGPAASVPALWGLREFDAFLLVVDGIPSGGAFTPALATLNLFNVERIEVLKGAAPVSYGATSFVGVIHVIHYAAGTDVARVEVGVGSRGSARVALALPMSNDAAGIQSSLLLDGEKRELSPDRAGYHRAHILYRLASNLGDGRFTLDFDGNLLRQDPFSPHPREAGVLTPRFPTDSNINPRDARIDENRVQLALGYAQNTSLGEWDTRFAAARSDGNVTRGFLREDFSEDGVTPNADGYRQSRDTTEIYFDTHLTTTLSDRATLVWGLDHMYGDGSQDSKNFEYAVFPDGSNAPNSHDLPIDETTELNDRRNFSGAYADLHFAATDRWHLEAGVRLNHTKESRDGAEVDLTSGSPIPAESGEESRTETRWTTALGTSYRLWDEGRDGISVFANYRDAFKPAVIDFGPEAESEILKSESAKSYEAGFKGEHADGRFEWELAMFRMNFRNLVVPQDIDGSPGLTNAGHERFKGVEVESRYRFSDDFSIKGSWSYHDARFGDYVKLFGDTPTQLRGKLLELAPQHLASVGLLYAPAEGLNANVVANQVGWRFLNQRNTSRASAYTMVDAGIGYRFDRSEVRLDGYNLTDRRDPAAESELGDAQYYRLPARSVEVSFRYAFGAR